MFILINNEDLKRWIKHRKRPNSYTDFYSFFSFASIFFSRNNKPIDNEESLCPCERKFQAFSLIIYTFLNIIFVLR